MRAREAQPGASRSDGRRAERGASLVAAAASAARSRFLALANFLPDADIAPIGTVARTHRPTLVFDGELAPSMVPGVLEPGREPPLRNDAFGTVLCLHVLEEPGDRNVLGTGAPWCLAIEGATAPAERAA